MNETLYTVGHSTHSLGQFLDLLSKHKVSAIADVRSTPYSRRHPHFNKEALSKALHAVNISYVFLGKELGTKNPPPDCIVDGKVQYHLIASKADFSSGLDRVIKGMLNYRIALMCVEEDPLSCHRTLLICRHLRSRVESIEHIRGNGILEINDAFEQRLVDKAGAGEEDLFLSKRDSVENAYTILGAQITQGR
jgi:uncharacterized protein (DUF488 family)